MTVLVLTITDEDEMNSAGSVLQPWFGPGSMKHAATTTWSRHRL